MTIYNVLMLLLVLWPSAVYWMDIFTAKVGEESLFSIGFLRLSNLFELLSDGFRFLHMEDEEAITSLLGAAKYIFIATAVLAAIRYILDWIKVNNGRPVRLWRIIGCYVLPVFLFLVAMNIMLLVWQNEGIVSHITDATGKVLLLPSLNCVLSMVVPPVIGCVVRPFLSNLK